MTVCKKSFKKEQYAKFAKNLVGNKNLQKIAQNNNFHKACQE